MSFTRTPIVGLTYVWSRGGRLLTQVPSSLTTSAFPCTNGVVSMSCPETRGGITVVTVDPRDAVMIETGVPLATDATLYRIGVAFDGPPLVGGYIACLPPPAVGCDFPDQGMYDGTLSGSYLMLTGATSAPYAPPSTFDAPPTGFGPGAVAITQWPWEHAEGSYVGATDNDLGYLVNGSPTWPVPDANGNTFAQCLFTYAQIPTITVTMNWGTSNTEEGVLRVDVGTYYADEVAPSTRRRVDVL